MLQNIYQKKLISLRVQPLLFQQKSHSSASHDPEGGGGKSSKSSETQEDTDDYEERVKVEADSPERSPDNPETPGNTGAQLWRPQPCRYVIYYLFYLKMYALFFFQGDDPQQYGMWL